MYDESCLLFGVVYDVYILLVRFMREFMRPIIIHLSNVNQDNETKITKLVI